MTPYRTRPLPPPTPPPSNPHPIPTSRYTIMSADVITMVKMIETLDEFQACVAGNKKVVVDFTATWCGPCKMIGPYFEECAGQYPDITFVKVDVDDNADTAQACQVSAMPTFIFFQDGKPVDKLMGANKDALLEKIKAF